MYSRVQISVHLLRCWC